MSFFDVEGLSRKTISIFFLIKIFFGLCVWFVYTFYYSDRENNDVFKFFDDGAVMFSVIRQHPMRYLQMVLGINTDASYLVPYYQQMANWYKPWADATYHNNRIIIQFNGLIHLFSFGYYNVHTVFMCFLSLIGLTGIYKTFYSFLKGKTKELTLAVFLIPSVLFWGSGVLKEGIVLFGLGLLMYYVYQFLFVKKSFNGFVWIVFAALILAFTKIYVFVAILPSLICLILFKYTGHKQLFFKFVGVYVLVFLLAINLYRINPEWDLLKALEHKQWSLTSIAREEKAGSLIETFSLQSNTLSFIRNAPDAIVNTLFRPHIFESRTLFMFISGLENLFFIMLALASIVFFKKPDKEVLPLLYTSIFFVLTLALLIGIVNPVLGSIVRFKIPLLPFLAIIFILILDKEKLIKKFNFLLLKKPSLK